MIEDDLRRTMRRHAASLRVDEEIAWEKVSSRTTTPSPKRGWVVVLAGAAAVLTGVAVVALAHGGSDPDTVAPGGSTSCAPIVVFQGHEYRSYQALVLPEPAEVVGEARVPGCDDSGQGETPGDTSVRVARIPGVAADLAVVAADTPQVLYVRADLADLPPEIARFLAAPSCDPADVPIELQGTWLSIVQPDGTTELDMHPPYDLGLLVTQSSSAKYLRAELTIRVPSSLPPPLTHRDVVSTLWKGGSIRATVGCVGDRFVAFQVEVPPLS